MGLKDIMNAGKIRRENDNLRGLLNPEMQDAAKLAEYISQLEKEKEKIEKDIQRLSCSVAKLKNEAIFFEEAIVYQDFGLYTPRYNFVSAEEYKLRLDQIRTIQKSMIKGDTAIFGSKTWTVDGSKNKGAKMINDMKKLLLRAFNSDCEKSSALVTAITYFLFSVESFSMILLTSSIFATLVVIPISPFVLLVTNIIFLFYAIVKRYLDIFCP